MKREKCKELSRVFQKLIIEDTLYP